MNPIDKKIEFAMDKVPYPSDKFYNIFKILNISKEQMLGYLLNPENKYGFDSKEELETLIYETLIVTNGDTFKIVINSPYDEYVKIKITEVLVDDYNVIIYWDIDSIKLKHTSDGNFYYSISDYQDSLEYKDYDNDVLYNYIDDQVGGILWDFGNKFGLNFEG